LPFSHVDRGRAAVRQHPFRRLYRDRLFVYNPEDRPIPYLPTLGPSLDRRSAWRQREQASPYVHYLANSAVTCCDRPSRPRYLYSFAGDINTHPVRRRLPALHCPPTGHIRATPAKWPTDAGEREAFRRTYFDDILSAKFVLCPRGRGTSSVRLFETMALGRVPVIISDQWIPPHGPKWASCAVFVPEARIAHIPDALREAEPDWEQLATNAFDEWQKWFSPETVFDTLVGYCLHMLAYRRQPESVIRWAAPVRRLRNPISAARLMADICAGALSTAEVSLR
jgi:hypothetical protein